ncbi:MAG: sensor histidine kinase, partial [Novosphingobium sp.]|nr:sensor histidine kinase [Novosphingobium sp.]
MHFDDRLATVLRLAASSETLASTQFCQLVDLLGIMPSGHRSEQVDAAYLRLADLGRRLPAARRARMIAQPGVRLRNPRLVSELAQGERDVADAAVTRADLGEEQWLDLL